MFIFLALFIFLFIIYLLSKEDFLFMRKNVPLEQVFNIVIPGLFAALFFSRLDYVVIHWRVVYTNPLVFILIPYFPGLSLPGGILGFILYLLWILKNRKLPTGRIFDISALAFLIASSVYLVITEFGLLILRKHFGVFNLLHMVFYLVFFFFFISAVKVNRIKDGIVGSIILAFYSIIPLLEDTFQHRYSLLGFWKEDGIYVMLCIANVIILISRSNALSKKNNL